MIKMYFLKRGICIVIRYVLGRPVGRPYNLDGCCLINPLLATIIRNSCRRGGMPRILEVRGQKSEA